MTLYCPVCREPNANVTLSLVDGDTFQCQECGDEFTTADAREVVKAAKAWAEVLVWAEQCPGRRPQAVEAE